jgi:hypothetical protein
MAALIMLILQHSPGRASQDISNDARAAANSTQSQTSAECSSASLWQKLPGSRVSLTIGDRTLHVPVSLPFFHVDRDGGRNSVWFDFHINGANQWSFGGYDPSKPYAWEYLLSIEITSAPGRQSNSEFLSTFLNGAVKSDDLSRKSKNYDVYPDVVDDKFVAKANHNIQLYCINSAPQEIKQVPACIGHVRPWKNAALNYTFGRQFLDNAPSIMACISDLLDTFSR